MLMLAVKISRVLRKRQLTPLQRNMPEKIEAKISRKNATPRPLHKGRHVLQSVKGETNLVETTSIFSFRDQSPTIHLGPGERLDQLEDRNEPTQVAKVSAMEMKTESLQYMAAFV